MTAHRITYRTPYSLGSLRLVTLRRRRGYAIAHASGDIAYWTCHPVTGRPMPATEQDPRRALLIAAMILDA